MLLEMMLPIQYISTSILIDLFKLKSCCTYTCLQDKPASARIDALLPRIRSTLLPGAAGDRGPLQTQPQLDIFLEFLQIMVLRSSNFITLTSRIYNIQLPSVSSARGSLSPWNTSIGRHSIFRNPSHRSVSMWSKAPLNGVRVVELAGLAPGAQTLFLATRPVVNLTRLQDPLPAFSLPTTAPLFFASIDYPAKPTRLL